MEWNRAFDNDYLQLFAESRDDALDYKCTYDDNQKNCLAML